MFRLRGSVGRGRRGGLVQGYLIQFCPESALREMSSSSANAFSCDVQGGLVLPSSFQPAGPWLSLGHLTIMHAPETPQSVLRSPAPHEEVTSPATEAPGLRPWSQ